MVKKAFMQKVEVCKHIFDCLFDLAQTALMQRVEILKRVWFVKYMVFVAPNRKAVCQLSCYCIK